MFASTENLTRSPSFPSHSYACLLYTSAQGQALDSPVKAARARGISVSLENEGAKVPSEINVIGRTVDDASREVERFVDRAFLAGLPRVRVVHGSGMGVLRKACLLYTSRCV